MSAPIERDLPPVSNQSMHANTSAPPPDDEFPNLVTQLQQMHGLTKKKVYGTKPKRRPFVSAEVFREHPRKSSSLSPVSPSDTNHGGRVTSPSVLDRAGRVYHQGGSVLQQPSAAAVPRALMDISGTSSLASASNMSPEANAATPGSSYHSPTSAIPIPPAPNPPSPILNHAPPFWDPSVPLPSRATVTYQQPPPSIPISSALNLHPGGSRLHQAYPTGPNPSAGIKLPETAGIPALTTSSRRDGGVVPPLFGSANALDNRRLSGYPGKNENQASPPPPMNVTVSASSNAANLNYSIPPAPHRRSVSGPVFRGGESSGLSLSSSAHSEQGRSSLAGPSSTMTMTVSPDQQQPSRRRFTHAPSLSEGSSSSSYPPTQNPYPVVPPLPPPASTPWHNNSDNNAFVDSPISSYTSSPTSPLTTTTSTTTAPMTTLSPYGMTMTLTTGGHVQPASSHYEYDSSASVPAAASSYPSSPISSSTSSLTGWAG
ncbi:hypothetical protein GYMLUDRAFT_433584 [Collybiopsis luxurians FD-317 M1]|uniref:Uncharacterized protein n=1 Tax=Collybiopsis luxurians FD-317 M1 TaxID=944289 RepID=A0A0D0D474_9AGAR|nr:hypothetical protein GYMLUDRAFT_433584 [Collybiopsis luxurians FD-317 M1]